jgi:hypothetical protein
MTNLDDVLSTAIQKGFYRNITQQKTIFYKFTSFGSQNCLADSYDEDGELIKKKESIRTEERISYKLVPKENLPEKLKAQD